MKKVSMFFVLFLIFGTNLRAQTLIESGHIAYGARHYKDAISYYERAIIENSSDIELNLRLANCYRYTNDMQKAEARYEWVCKSASVPPSAHYFYATVLMANKKYDQAKEAFAKASSYNAVAVAQGLAACDFAKNNSSKESAFTINRENISTPDYDDYAPILHQGKVIFTSSRKVDYGTGGYSDPKTQNFLYETTKGADGQLSGLKIIKNPQSAVPTSNISPIAITTNESRGVTTLNEFATGIRHIRNASLVKLDMEITNMSTITDFPIGEPFAFLNNRPASFPEFTNNGNTLYFAADGLDGGQGGFDIWVTHFQNGKWTAPKNLGPNVNTPGDEICPHIANNGDLYFASDYHKGFGGYDVFKSKKVNNVWKEVRNLGTQVNSSYDDMYFVYDGFTKIGYFSSNRDGSTYNIYSASMKGDESLMPLVNEKEAVVAIVEPNPTNNNNNTVNNNTANNNTNNSNNNTVADNGNSKLNQTNSGGYKPTSNGGTGNKTNTNELPIDGYKTDNGTATNTTASNNKTNTGSKTNSNTTANTSPTTTGDGNTVPCAMNFYIGGVIDAETQRPLEGATVYIKNLKKGQELKVKDPTNVYGEYSVILDPLSDYTIAISKAGYKNLVFDVNTGNGGKKTLLGTRPLYAAATLERDKFGNVIQAEGVVINTTPTEQELLNPVKSTGKTFTFESNGKPMPKTGYLIQAIMATKLTEEERLELSQYGNIITEPRGNKTVYRVGIFVDEQHLEKSLADIKKTYKDAFKVPVELKNDDLAGKLALSSQVIYPLVPAKPTPVPVVDEKPAVVVETPTVKENNNNSWANNENFKEEVAARGTVNTEPQVAFKVQLGAFQQPEGISFKNISHLGTIEQTKKANGLTYFYLAGFKTIDAARTARTKAQESGVPSPFIVAFKNGVQVNISDVVK